MTSAPFLATTAHPPATHIATTHPGPGPTLGHVLRFESLFNAGRGYSFPCDAQGRVSLDRLSERARDNYLFARACVGREFAHPHVLAELH